MALRLISLGSLYRPLNTFKISKFLNGKNLSTTKTESYQAGEGNRSWLNKMHGKKHLFSFEILKKNYEILPLLLIVGGGIAILSGFVLRIAMTRDDVRYAGELPYEKTNLESAKKRKLIIFNQNYDTVDELKSIYKDMYPENENNTMPEKEKV